MLALRVLGGFQVVRDGLEVSELTAQPGRAALLVFLALEGSTTRDAVVALLWPERDALKARHALSQTLHRLRGALGEEWLETEGERLAIPPSVAVDARSFAALVERGEHEQALRLYRGPFLPGWYLAESPPFELWVDRQRARLERLHRHARREWIRTRRERGDVAAALSAAQQWAEIDPLEDEAQHRLIELLAESGRRADALRQFELYRRLLEKEELSPLDETVELVARLRQASDVGAFADADADATHARPAAGTASTVASPSPAAPAATLARDGSTTSGGGVPASPGDIGTPGPTRGARRPSRVRVGLRALPGWVRAGLVVGAVALAAVLTIVGRELFTGARDRRVGLPPGGRVLLADFDNDTRDTLISGVVTEALRVDLQRHLRSGLADPAEVARELARMRRGPGPVLTADLAREVAIRAGIPAVIGGRVGSVGPGFVLSSWIVSAASGRILDAALATARDSTELIEAIETLSGQLRSVIRPSLTALPPAPPLARVTTSSLDALRKYTAAALSIRTEGNNARAARLLEEAVALDTAFAMAYRALGMVRLNTGAPRRSWTDALEAAYRHRDRLSEPERYLTIASYHQAVTGEVDEAIQAYQNLLDLDSAQLTGLNNLAVIYRDLRDYPRSEALLRRCVAADSLVLTCGLNLSTAVLAQGRGDDARAIAERVSRIHPESRDARAQLVWIAAANFDYTRAESLMTALVRGNPASLGHYQRDFALLDMVRGRVAEAQRHIQAAYRSAWPARPLMAQAALEQEAWLELAVRRDTARALAAMDVALRDSSMLALDSAEVPYLEIADFFLNAGRPERAGTALRAHLVHVPVNVRRSMDRELYSVRGLLAMQLGRVEEAAEAFRVADTHGGSPLLVLQYLGQLHEQAGRPDSAIAAYERYLAASVPDRVLWDAALLPDVLERLAILNERRGHSAEAARYYTRLAELWSGADAELQPRAAAARRRAALLRPAT